MSQFLTLGASGKTLKFRLFVIRVHYEKLGHLLTPLLSKFCLYLLTRLRDIAEKTAPHEAETDSKRVQSQ